MKLMVRVLLNLKWIQIMIQLIQLTIPLMSTPMTLYKVVILYKEVQNIFLSSRAKILMASIKSASDIIAILQLS